MQPQSDEIGGKIWIFWPIFNRFKLQFSVVVIWHLVSAVGNPIREGDRVILVGIGVGIGLKDGWREGESEGERDVEREEVRDFWRRKWEEEEEDDEDE